MIAARKTIRGAFLAPLLLAWACAPIGDEPDQRALDEIVQKALKEWRAPGVAVGIVRDGKVIYLAGHGTRRIGSKDRVTPDTLFPIASCTKAFTTTAMAILVDEGKMAWDDPVRRHLPWFHLGDADADKLVTLRDLVTHRTGLRGHDLLWYHSPWSLEEIVQRAGRLPLDRPFRKSFQYQSTMFTAAGLAVAADSRTTWADFVRKRLLLPLDMTQVVFSTDDARKAEDCAFPHRLDQHNKPYEIDFYPIALPDPAGCIHASARDLTKWLLFQLGDGAAGGKRLVSAANLLETHSPQIEVLIDRTEQKFFPETRRMDYGMGWLQLEHRGHKLLCHAGAIDGFRAHLTLVPDKGIGIVLLANLQQTRMNLALNNALLDALLGMAPRDWNSIGLKAGRQEAAERAEEERERLAKRHSGTRPSRELQAYAGEYEHPAYGRVEVSVASGSLVWQWNDFKARLEHFEYDTFTLPIEAIWGPQVIFTLQGGAVKEMEVTGRIGVTFQKRSR
jgi:CubicO group peptidase (beta-lactamase class C family)